MKKVFALILAVALSLSLVSCSNNSNEDKPSGSQPSGTDTGLTQPVNLTLLSQGAGTDDYITLASEGKVLQANLPAGSNVVQETISSGCSSVGYLIEAGMGDFGTGQNAMSGTVGMEGKEPYSNISALMATVKYAFVAELATQSFANKTGCSTIAEVIEKQIPCRFVAEPVGSSDYVSLMYLLDIHGVTVEDIESWGGSVTFTDGSACCDMLQDGQADMMVGHTVSTSSSLTELCMSADIVVSGLTEEEIQGMCERGYAEASIPVGTFGKTTEQMPSACQASSKIVSSDMSDDLAYAMTKILVENVEKLSEDVAGYRDITYADMVDFDAMVVPMHPGAIKYFQEIGVLDDAGNYTGK
ncbi:TAXI family TRAP transporter solute-binding subunit [Pseudoflavonifractor phocaeensis]|uniref:TAXI family TRAP transporter solute-binding subunit n=1 Tax=Pseudoflavonifractor phocaeensis TaxID=1870988 RepID=UPI002109EB95|nr:TAXI family TRAP transporter solute-binding subunit [Pseudoflavonifractor phocaeensis]MCQ4864641.1 TAXI family TRAP transporter solute-binding subunit [Pseudoflavonifractor phocaeensis]